MRHKTWDKMMHRLLTEQKEMQAKAKKAKGSKPDFLDLDKDGDKSEPMSKAAKEAGGKKDAPKSKKGKGKIPPQLRMHIKKKKKDKIDEAIEYLEKILIENLDEEQADAMLDEYGEDRSPLMEEEDDDFDADELPDYGEQDFGDYGEESMKKFAQKSKAFSDKYTEEDEYEETEETCPECGSDEFDGEHCDECGHEQSDEDLEDDDIEDDDIEDDDIEESVEYLSEAEVKKKQPRLGKVTRNPSGSNKKFHVYVKCGGRVKKISFGDPGLSIKRDSAARRKNFRARHKCDKPAGKDRCTARYWSCYQWRAGKKVEGEE